MTQELFKVVSTVKAPGGERASKVSETILSRQDLSAKYPRARTYGGLVLSRYELETGIYDSELREERIEPEDDSEELVEDPRDFDDRLDPSKLPEGYVIGEGYSKWQVRTNPTGHICYE